MVVPARPVAGAPIETTWGDVVHDSIVALEIQTGTVTGIATGTSIQSKAVTFPHAFAGIPQVFTNGTVPTGPSASWATGISATGFTVNSNRVDGGTGGFTTCDWIAIGPRA